ncbi:ABC transporter substrate-binding protein [Clavibacter michiganensis]|uniref:Lactose-binding protein n=2 Tax=Clavibacter michiganensis subsp. michiganensis TaxID=33013 RepID=A0A1Y3FIS3_CLAMM|nr:sugar ABC transporter substrate-binding protein [Clavibacter michiganensis]KAF0258040.1 Lactose-binding protein precursor [Clavibacter michiganensis subsp. michiganensis]MBE3078905.1 sugar ABC transporter substrate-binding protein [Clavibacter michiganensis subsp. michiganensis]MBF4638165.1 sugar ABC transporter substrate-binding protein [Clavibacter michiganensis subsp. michiganensis]MBW8027326.1 sugar ABC transporter substrate-binding protein [Clavibacter michiganensis subsp. michiganensis
MSISFPRRAKRAIALGLGIVLAGSLAACSSGSGGGASADSASADDLAKALDTQSSITVWGWAPAIKPIAEAFEKEHPKITVDVQNVGTGADQYTKLQNAIKAGKGAPDVAQIEYFAIPQFALGKSLADLSGYGYTDLKDQFTASTWNAVTEGDALYALPQDSGPMAMFYRQDIFDKYQIAVPTTWDEYVAAAEKMHAADPNQYITSDSGDAGFTTSMIWQAGGHPYKVDGDKVTIDMQDAGAKKYTAMWNQLVANGSLAQTPGWTDEWFRGLGDGSIATLITGAWMPGNLEAQATEGSGQWRVAPMPQYTAGDTATAESGGSSIAVMQQSQNKLVAAEFAKFTTADEQGRQISFDAGGFPSTTADLNSDEFLNETPEYFGGQKINEVLSAASKEVVPDWQYLPFQVYTNSIFSDSASSAYSNGTSLDPVLEAWGKAAAEYGQQQGFTVDVK